MWSDSAKLRDVTEVEGMSVIPCYCSEVLKIFVWSSMWYSQITILLNLYVMNSGSSKDSVFIINNSQHGPWDYGKDWQQTQQMGNCELFPPAVPNTEYGDWTKVWDFQSNRELQSKLPQFPTWNGGTMERQLDQELNTKRAELRTKWNLPMAVRNGIEDRKLKKFIGTMSLFLVVSKNIRSFPPDCDTNKQICLKKK